MGQQGLSPPPAPGPRVVECWGSLAPREQRCCLEGVAVSPRWLHGVPLPPGWRGVPSEGCLCVGGAPCSGQQAQGAGNTPALGHLGVCPCGSPSRVDGEAGPRPHPHQVTSRPRVLPGIPWRSPQGRGRDGGGCIEKGTELEAQAVSTGSRGARGWGALAQTSALRGRHQLSGVGGTGVCEGPGLHACSWGRLPLVGSSAFSHRVGGCGGFPHALGAVWPWADPSSSRDSAWCR